MFIHVAAPHERSSLGSRLHFNRDGGRGVPFKYRETFGGIGYFKIGGNTFIAFYSDSGGKILFLTQYL